MSLRRLIVLTAVDLLVVLLLGIGGVVLLAATAAPTLEWGLLSGADAFGLVKPLGLQDQFDRARTWRYTVSLDCTATPTDDRALLDWAVGHSGLQRVSVDRTALKEPPQAEMQRVALRYSGPAGLERLIVPWDQLGYRAGPPEPNERRLRTSPDTRYSLTDREHRLITIGFLQAGLVTVGLFHLWRRRRVPPTAPPSEGAALFAGLGMGLLLGALYWAFMQAALHWWPTLALAPSWNCMPSLGYHMGREYLPVFWRNLDPHVFVLGSLAVMALLVPLAQAVFFWGGMFSRWEENGRGRTGDALGGVAAALLLLSASFFLVAFLFATLLAWLQRRTHALGVPMLALVLLNISIIGVTFGLIPSFSHPTNQLPGTWEPVAVKGEIAGVPINNLRVQPLRFLRGGGASGDLPAQTVGGQRITRMAWRYDWTDKDRLRLTWLKYTTDAKGNTVAWETEPEQFGVQVDWHELTLTSERDGSVLKFRRHE